MSPYQRLLAELADLDDRIEQARARERAQAIETIHALMDTYGIKHKARSEPSTLRPWPTLATRSKP